MKNLKGFAAALVLLLVLTAGAQSASRWLRVPFGGAILFTPTGNQVLSGSGAPTMTAKKGSVYLRTNGTADTTLYVNPNGNGTWNAVQTASPTYTNLTATNFITATGGLIEADPGVVTAPSIAFVGDLDTGLYRIGANNLGIATNGAKVVDIGTSGAAVTGAVSATTTVTGQYIQATDTTQTLANSASLAVTAGKSLFPVAGSGGAVTGLGVASGTTNGKTITIIGTSDTNTCQFADAAGLNLGAATITLGLDDTLRLVWLTDHWAELSFTNN